MHVFLFLWALSSVGGHHLHTVGVAGSNPVAPTIKMSGQTLIWCLVFSFSRNLFQFCPTFANEMAKIYPNLLTAATKFPYLILIVLIFLFFKKCLVDPILFSNITY